MKFRFGFLMVMSAVGMALAESGEAGLSQSEQRSPWHFRVGPVMAPRVRVKVSGMRPVLPVRSSSDERRVSETGAKIAPAPSAGHVDRSYVDGYVKPDEGTDDPLSIVMGLTWDWVAKDVGTQYSGGKIEFHSDVAKKSETVSSSTFGVGDGAKSGSESDRDILLGVEAMGGWTFFEDDDWDVSLDLGFRYYGSGDLRSESKYGTSVTTTRSEYRYVDSYEASGWKEIPQGRYEGSAGGPGRLIGATPTRNEELLKTTSSTETRHYTGSMELNYDIWDLRIGPTVGWELTENFTLRAGVYGLLGLVDARLKTSVETPDGTYGAKKSKCEAVFGIAAGLSAQLYVSKDVYILGGIEYDWWTDSVSMKAGGANAQVKLSDFTVSISLGIEF